MVLYRDVTLLGRRESPLDTAQTNSLSAAPRRVGVMGGTFDPVHYGHLVIAEEVRVALNLAEIVFIPAGHPPHKSTHAVTDAAHRLTMLELALASNPYFRISHIELERTGPSYTVDTLHALREQWGANTAVFFIIGWDSLEELYTWHKATAILTAVTHLVAVRRPGYEEDYIYNTVLEQRLPGIQKRLLIVQAPQLEISATDLRQRVAEARPIKYQTPEAVETYIRKQRLYSTHVAGAAEEER